MAQRSDPRPVHRGPYPELTLTALLVGYLLGTVICVSMGYASLILGFSIEGSELAAILGWGILRGVLRRTSIVENNINQTIASAVNGASAGMMFSVPALFILDGHFPGVSGFSPVLMVLACITGGVLGLAFVIPLRKQMIDFNRLAYPGGIAVATILKSSRSGIRKAGLLLLGAAVSCTVHLLDLKSGYLVGASPRRQQIGQLLATWLGPIIVVTLIYVLHDAYTLGSQRLPAPQATALAGVIEGILGGDVPAFRYAAGAGLGLLMAGSGLGGIGVLIGLGFYMPFDIVLTYTIGNFVRMGAEAKLGRAWVDGVGIPLAAGFIVGEALAGVGVAMAAVLRGMG